MSDVPERQEQDAPTEVSEDEDTPPTDDVLLTGAGIFVIIALVLFFAVEMTNPDAYVLQDRTIYILLALIAALLGFNQFQSPVGGGGGTDLYGGQGGRRRER